MNVTLSEFVMKSLIEKGSIDLLYVDARYLANFLTELKPAAKIYGVDVELKAVIKDGSAMKFIKLYGELCEIVASFGGRTPTESEAMSRLNLEKLPRAKEVKAQVIPVQASNSPYFSSMYH